MATIDTLFKITAAVTGGNAVAALSQSIRSASTAGENLSRSLNQGAIALKAFAASAAVHELAEFIGKSIDLGEHLNNLSMATGVSIASLAKYKNAAQEVGISIDDLGKDLNKLNKNIIDAQTFGSKSQAAFASLGISIRDAAGNLKSTDQIFGEISDKFRTFPDGATKSALAMALFGKEGANLIPLLDKGKEGMQEFALSMDRDFGQAASRFHELMTRISTNTEQFSIDVAKQVLPALNDAVVDFGKLFDMSGAATTFGNVMAEAIRMITAALSGVIVGIENTIDGFKTAGAAAYGYFLEAKGALTLDNDTLQSGKDVVDQAFDGYILEVQKRQKDLEATTQRALNFGIVSNVKDYGVQFGPRAPAAAFSGKTPAINFGGASKMASEYESAAKAAAKFIATQQEELITLQQESQYIGMTTVEIEKMKDARKFDTEVAQKMINMSPAQAAAFKKTTDAIKEQRQAIIQLNYEQSRTFGAGAKEFFAKYIEEATDAAAQTKKVFGDAFQGMEDAWVKFVQTGKLYFKSLANSVIADLARIQFERTIAGFMQPGGFLSGLLGGGSSGGIGGFLSSFFADGGVMTSRGPLALNAYAGGGIARSPQLAMFGEGSMPEAYVPLPNGRSIPVEMKGGGASVVYNIDARGADVGVVDRIQDALKAVDGSIEGRARATVHRELTRNPAYGRR